jgi:NSS family neurotransmitter:Na+ symporter
MIAIPAAFVFLGPAVIKDPPGTFGMGFVTLPHVFNQMPAGTFFGFLFFFLLFMAAVTSSLSMLQPAIALLEEGLQIGRKPSVAIVGFITLTGMLFIVYFSKGFTALDTIDFWMANFFIFIMATLQVLMFSWYLGIDRGMAELKRGAEIRLPPGLGFVLKYVSPTFLIVVFCAWCWQSMPGRLKALVTVPEGEPPVVLMSVSIIVVVAVFFLLVISAANRRWDKEESEA